MYGFGGGPERSGDRAGCAVEGDRGVARSLYTLGVREDGIARQLQINNQSILIATPRGFARRRGCHQPWQRGLNFTIYTIEGRESQIKGHLQTADCSR